MAGPQARPLPFLRRQIEQTVTITPAQGSGRNNCRQFQYAFLRVHGPRLADH
jgi:hypothetical protein